MFCRLVWIRCKREERIFLLTVKALFSFRSCKISSDIKAVISVEAETISFLTASSCCDSSIIFSEFRLNATLLTFGINSLFAALARIFFSSPNVAIWSSYALRELYLSNSFTRANIDLLLLSFSKYWIGLCSFKFSLPYIRKYRPTTDLKPKLSSSHWYFFCNNLVYSSNLIWDCTWKAWSHLFTKRYELVLRLKYNFSSSKSNSNKNSWGPSCSIASLFVLMYSDPPNTKSIIMSNVDFPIELEAISSPMTAFNPGWKIISFSLNLSHLILFNIFYHLRFIVKVYLTK